MGDILNTRVCAPEFVLLDGSVLMEVPVCWLAKKKRGK